MCISYSYTVRTSYTVAVVPIRNKPCRYILIVSIQPIISRVLPDHLDRPSNVAVQSTPFPNTVHTAGDRRVRLDIDRNSSYCTVLCESWEFVQNHIHIHQWRLYGSDLCSLNHNCSTVIQVLCCVLELTFLGQIDLMGELVTSWALSGDG